MRNHPPSYAWQYIKRLPEGNMLCTLCNSFLATHYPTNAKNHLRRRHGLYGPSTNPQPPVDAKDGDAVTTFLESIGITTVNADAAPVMHLQSSSLAPTKSAVRNERPKVKTQAKRRSEDFNGLERSLERLLHSMRQQGDPVPSQASLPQFDVAPTKRLNLEKKVQALTQAVQSTSTSQVGSPGNNMVEMADSPSSEENRRLSPDNVRLMRVLAKPDTNWEILNDPDWHELLAGDHHWKVPTDRFVAMDLMQEAANQAHERIKYDLSKAQSKVAVIVNVRRSATTSSDPVAVSPLTIMVTVHFVNDDLQQQKAYLGSATCYESVRVAVDKLLSSFNIADQDVGAFVVENYALAATLLESADEGACSSETRRRVKPDERPSVLLGGEKYDEFDRIDSQLDNEFPGRVKDVRLQLNVLLQALYDKHICGQDGTAGILRCYHGTSEEAPLRESGSTPTEKRSWHAVITMLAEYLRQAPDLQVAQNLLDSPEEAPGSEELKFCEELVTILRPFIDPCGKHHALSTVYGQVQNLMFHLKGLRNTDNQLLAVFRASLLHELETRFEYVTARGSLYGLAALLDPREAFCVDVESFQPEASLLHAIRPYAGQPALSPNHSFDEEDFKTSVPVNGSYREIMLAVRREELLKQRLQEHDSPAKAVRDYLKSVALPVECSPLEFWRNCKDPAMTDIRQCAFTHLVIPSTGDTDVPDLVLRQPPSENAFDSDFWQRRMFVYLNRYSL